ncbi:peptidoglycan endopeptidase [Parasphingorhabdus cellanae]|uniref:Peptidoglycan endopeptidase n=2 Tax=Parasphingorhabdus cellanae TaxID=2806553 RepID=A0ABX7TB05_9SPHN|nr:peptidoglycan endopeptidase [Parasphingorhabdus cellanae]
MALQLCGTDFRLHGRSAEHGLDCIGLAAQCLGAADMAYDVPTGYSIRGGSIAQIAEVMTLAGFAALPRDEPLCEGDIVLVRPSPIQWHLMVRTEGGFVHAHAGLGEVVFTPGEAQWPLEAIFRILED